MTTQSGDRLSFSKRFVLTTAGFAIRFDRWLTHELQPASAQVPMPSCSEMTHNGSLERVPLWQLVEVFRAIRTKNEAKDSLVVLTYTWDERESPLEVKYIRIFREIFSQLIIKQPRSTRSDTKRLARVDARKGTTYTLERLGARLRGEGMRRRDMQSQGGVAFSKARAKLRDFFLVVPEQWTCSFRPRPDVVWSDFEPSGLV
jgi:hypothetical protein